MTIYNTIARAVAYVGIPFVTLSGCTSRPDSKPEYSETTRTVPVLSIEVMPGDKLERILRNELSTSQGFGIIPGHTSFPRKVTMYGDGNDKPYNRTKGQRNVIYDFPLDDVMRTLNPKRWEHAYPATDARLIPGERINVPDFSGDGNIAGRTGTPRGTLTFRARRNVDHNVVVDRTFNYK